MNLLLRLALALAASASGETCATAGACFVSMSQAMRDHRDGKLSDPDYQSRMRALYLALQPIADDPSRPDAPEARTMLSPGNVMSSHISDNIPDTTARVEDFPGLREQLNNRTAEGPKDAGEPFYLPGIDLPTQEPHPVAKKAPAANAPNAGEQKELSGGGKLLADGIANIIASGAKKAVTVEDQQQAVQVVQQIAEHPAAASRSLDAASKRQPDNPDILATAAVAHELAGDHEGAVSAARHALSLDPGNPLARLLIGHPEEFQASRSSVGALKNPFEERAPEKGAVDLRGAPSGPAARAAAEKALAASAAGVGPGAPLSTKAQFYLQSAVDKLALGDFKGALFDVSRALLVDPNNVRARVLRAHISNLPGIHNYEAAIKEAQEALKLDPKNAAALFEKGYAELELGQIAQALSDIETGLALEPNNAMGRLYHAMALEKAGLVAKAIEEYERAAALDAALRPLVDDALARLREVSTSAPHGRLPRSIPMKDVLWLLLGLTAFALVFEGGKRVLYKDWKTTVPARPDERLPATASGTLAPGAMLGGNFRIERELARGGIGIVYQATDVLLKRTVAIKHLNKNAYESAAVREKFLKEAQLAAKLAHPNLAQIFSVVGDGELYLVFEFVEGETLHSRLSRKIKLPLVEIKQILREVAEAVDYAHAHNIIHRDIKPANIMMTADGHYKVLDFGIAHETRNLDEVTMTQAWGTPPYMAPEQEMGTVRKESDLYALGVTLYELVVGQRPFQGAGMLEHKLKNEFPPIKRANPDAAAALQPFFAKVLDSNPDKRFSSAKEMYRALEAIEPTPVRS